MQNTKASQLLLLLKTVGNQVTQNFEKQTGLSLTRYGMLVYLSQQGELPQTELQRHIRIDQGAITRHLKILEEKKYVVRVRNPQNNREVLVQATDLGKSVIATCADKKNSLLAELFEGFSDEEITNLEQMLMRLCQNNQLDE
ncbi:hypothetical protein BAU15_03590 [Enterococcus sp. JM4C]|uniref:MarR family winged helix-turn-helix transcriptional regulator n=1 Tax=Candidatus Enterococcus huntleyi TaxID=1857217 RepID=UPI00137940BF|nr:MarR family transcriptional regulator [Enterococcus sp. JM4C]KAF1295635.1 hypothetical protein BAU15_03590 [Enterococcus sp. JM4C]